MFTQNEIGTFDKKISRLNFNFGTSGQPLESGQSMIVILSCCHQNIKSF